MKFNKSILSLIFIIATHYVIAQKNIFFDSMYTQPISTVDWQKADAEELKPFEKILDTYNLLTLAEPYHNEGASYDAQCMIVKGLIDKGAIKVVYTESSWLNIEKINAVLKKYGRDSIVGVKKYMNSVALFYWTQNGFWEYLANQIINNKVRLVGIDIGVPNNIMHELLNEFASQDSSFFYQRKYNDVRVDLGQILNSVYDVNYSEVLYNESTIFVNKAIDFYKSENALYKVNQWQMIASYLYWRYYRNFDLDGNRLLAPFDDGKRETFFHAIRDSIMCDIFVDNWQPAHSKAVLLISAYHAMRNSSYIENLDDSVKFNYVNTFGERLDRKKILKIYNLCFISSFGYRGLITPIEKSSTKVTHPKKNSIEQYLAKKTYPYLFVDFNGFCENSFYMNAFNKGYLKAKWGKVFSGVFFIKKMYPMQWFNLKLN